MLKAWASFWTWKSYWFLRKYTASKKFLSFKWERKKDVTEGYLHVLHYLSPQERKKDVTDS